MFASITIILFSYLMTGFDYQGLLTAFFYTGCIFVFIGASIGDGSHYGSHYHPDKPYDGMVGHLGYQDFDYIEKAMNDGFAIAMPGILCFFVSAIMAILS